MEKINVNKILGTLILIDIIFSAIHLILGLLYVSGHITNIDSYSSWLITSDLSYGEFFQYFKFAIIILILLDFVFFQANYNFICWLLLFNFLLLDDALQFHERFGLFISNNLNWDGWLGLRGRDIGELVYFLFIGLLFSILLISTWKNGKEFFKKVNFELAILIVFLAFFGVFIDVFHSMLQQDMISKILGLVEDGGEMIITSLIVWYVLLLRTRQKRNENFLYRKIFSPLYKITSLFNP